VEDACESGQGHQPTAQVLHQEHQDSRANAKQDDDVEVVPPGRPHSLGSQDRIVEMMKGPEQEHDRQESRGRTPCQSAIALEDPCGEAGRHAEEEDRGPGGEEEAVEPIDGQV
jgi:hypothetical protein